MDEKTDKELTEFITNYEIEHSIFIARQHVIVAKQCIENGVDDLIDYSIKKAERWTERAERYLNKLVQ